MSANRIKELRKKLNLTQEGFAEKLGIRQGNVGDWERGRSSPSYEALQYIVKTYNVNLNWFITGEGSMFLPQISAETEKLEIKQKVYNFVRNELNLLETDDVMSPTEKGEFWYLPLRGEIAAGPPLPFEFESEPLKYVSIAKNQLPNPNICDVFRVNGDSMEPKIEHSDIVVIKKSQDWWACDKKIVAVRTYEGLTLKRLVIDHVKNSSCLVPFNSKYDIIFADEESQLVGYLIFLIRQC